MMLREDVLSFSKSCADTHLLVSDDRGFHDWRMYNDLTCKRGSVGDWRMYNDLTQAWLCWSEGGTVHPPRSSVRFRLNTKTLNKAWVVNYCWK